MARPLQFTPSLRMGKMAQQLTSDIFAELLVLRADLINDAEESLASCCTGCSVTFRSPRY